MSKKIKDFYKKGRFQQIEDYRLDKYIFRGVLGVLVLLFLVALAQTGFSFEEYVYFYCPEDARGGLCENPFYNNFHELEGLPSEFQELVDLETLPAGFEIGERQPWLFSNFGVLALFLVLLALVINHLIYNRPGGRRGIQVRNEGA